MHLYFQHRDETVTLVASNITEDKASKLIYEDVARRNPKFKIYYLRRWQVKDHIIFDCGSHTEFYILTDIFYKNGEKPSI